MAGHLGIYGGDYEPEVAQMVNPNTSFVFADSHSRNMLNDPSPTDFLVNLNNSASGGRRITHRTLQWTQPLWWHNFNNWEMRISFSTDDFQQVYVGYVMPYISYNYFAGEEKDKKEYQDIDPGGYCGMLQEMLRTGLRKIETPLTPVGVINDVPLDDFNVKYSRYRGLMIYLDQQNVAGNAVLFRIEKCSWLEKGNNVHGFGVKTEDLFQNQSYEMEKSLYELGVNMYFAGGTAHGTYTRYVAIVSKEICRNRKITSFSNLAESGRLNAVELAIIPVVREKQNLLQNYVTKEDPTIVNLKLGDNLQSFRITMIDEFGDIVRSGMLPGNPLNSYAAYRAIKGLPKTFDLLNSIYAPPNQSQNVLYDNDVISALLQEEQTGTGFFSINRLKGAFLDQSSPIAHYFEITMF